MQLCRNYLTPILNLISTNFGAGSTLVKASAIWSPVGIYFNLIVFAFICSLEKWYLMSICLVLL